MALIHHDSGRGPFDGVPPRSRSADHRRQDQAMALRLRKRRLPLRRRVGPRAVLLLRSGTLLEIRRADEERRVAGGWQGGNAQLRPLAHSRASWDRGRCDRDAAAICAPVDRGILGLRSCRIIRKQRPRLRRAEGVFMREEVRSYRTNRLRKRTSRLGFFAPRVAGGAATMPCSVHGRSPTGGSMASASSVGAVAGPTGIAGAVAGAIRDDAATDA